MEKRLLCWITDQVSMGFDYTKREICDTAVYLMNRLSDQLGIVTKFSGSHGWFERFKKRNNLVYKKRVGESLMVDSDDVKQCREVFQSVVEKEGYLPEQVFNCDETGLLWKKKRGSSYVSTKTKGQVKPRQM